MKIFYFLGLILMPISFLWASNGKVIIAVGEASLERQKIIFQKPQLKSSFNLYQEKTINEFHSIFTNDFNFYKKKFLVINPKNEKISNFGIDNFDYWSGRQFKYFVKFLFEKTTKKNILKFKVQLADAYNKKIVLKMNGKFLIKNVRSKAHFLADLIFQNIENKKSIFNTKIIFVSDMRTKLKKKIKELHTIDFDGKNLKRLTYHRGIVISPSVSPNGTKVLYTLIRSGTGRKNLNLYSMNLKSKRAKIISSKRGINSGAVFTKDGKKIILTLSHTGNAEIYEIDLKTNFLRKITHHFGVDVDPDISKDGSLITFLSNRSGKAMIYTAKPSGKEKEVKRIGFVGQFNATPRFSPSGEDIVFSSWVDNSFDIFRIKTDGSQIYRLTKNFGSNEEATYSPDGQFITFSSQKINKKRTDQNIYIMDRDGELIGQVTAGIGFCTTPRWYNPLKF
jgi:TolB protein